MPNPRALTELLANNRAWSQSVLQSDPQFFHRLSQQQSPRYLWIGCSDSRVPANQIIGMAPGEVFVHRNVANVVVHTDLNCLSTIQFAVDLIQVEHIIVCGHYGCSGVHASLTGKRVGLADNWLRNVVDIGVQHAGRLAVLEHESQRHDRLCELNAIEQVINTCQTTVVQDAWQRGQSLTVHAWCYGLRDGQVRDLELSLTGGDDMDAAYARALQRLDASAPGATT